MVDKRRRGRDARKERTAGLGKNDKKESKKKAKKIALCVCCRVCVYKHEGVGVGSVIRWSPVDDSSTVGVKGCEWKEGRKGVVNYLLADKK